MKVDKKHQQVFWAFGVLERLANLGFIENPPFCIAGDKIDLFLEIDSYCQILFDTDEEFDALLKLVCKDAGVTDPEQVVTITQIARDYKDNRDELVKFALNNSILK